MIDMWNELVTAAALGVERRPFTPPSTDGALADTLGRIDLAAREDALLSAAATVALYQRAGWLPPRDSTPRVPVCDTNDLPICTQRAARRLATILDGTHRALLPEWLAALAASGRRVPNVLLPDLLELGRTQAELREMILPVLGKRGRWLAAHNSAWDYARFEYAALAHELDAEQREAQNAQLRAEWETGSRAARVTLLQRARATVPTQARDLLSTTWTTEKADDRAAFLATFAIGLSMDDEPFLESALDDRSKEVRRAASELLARLPESRLARRMWERIQPLVTWISAEKPRLLGLRPGQPARLAVVLPETCDKAMIRDGVEPKPPSNRSDMGEKGWWLFQLLRAIPPDRWSRQWSATPAELLKAAAQSEWKALLQEAWLLAALAFRDAAWAKELLRVEPRHTQLFGALSPQQQEALLLDILSADCTPLHKHAVLGLLRQTHHTWSVKLTRAVLKAVHRHMVRWQDSYDYQLRGALTEDFARLMPPVLLDEIAHSWPNDPAALERWQGVIDRLLITLQFRHDMLSELRTA